MLLVYALPWLHWAIFLLFPPKTYQTHPFSSLQALLGTAFSLAYNQALLGSASILAYNQALLGSVLFLAYN